MNNPVPNNWVDLSREEKRALLADLLRKKAVETRTAPLSFAQQRLFVLSELDSSSAAYNIPRALRLRGDLSLPALRQTFNSIVTRHEVLRGSFAIEDGRPIQRIATRLEIELPVVNLEGLNEIDREKEISELIAAEALRPFDLSGDPLLRLCLLRLSPRDHVLLLTMHHIVSDGWSIGILVREMTAIYQAIVEQRVVNLPALPIQYADFACWQRDWLQGKVLEEQFSYWKQQLAGAPTVLNLPFAGPRKSLPTFRGSYATRTLSKELSEELAKLSRREGVTLFMTLLAAFQTLLYRYSGQEDLVVGSPIAGRNRAETEDLIGFFINTLPLRTSFSGNPTFRKLLQRVRDTALGAFAHQDLPFEKVVEELQPERSLSHAPVFQVMFTLQNQPRSALTLKNIEITSFQRKTETAKFDLTLYITPSSEGLRMYVEYSTDLFDPATIERMISHLEVLLTAIVDDPEQAIARLPLLTAAEQNQIVVGWNNTKRDYPRGLLIHQLVEAQTEKTPDAIAVVHGEGRLSYRDLNSQANQLASYLQRLGVGPEARVGVCLPRSVEMIIAILGVLKAGAAYVPLDPIYPRERLAFTLKDADAVVLLTQAELLKMLPEVGARVVCIDSDWKTITREDQSNPHTSVSSHNLAYVIYTSGSTGRPKGVAIEHASSVTFLQWVAEDFKVEDLAAVLASTSICFDLSVFEMFAPLSAGGKVVLVENALHLPGLRSEPVTLVNTVPSAMAELVRMRGIPPTVRTINLAGEPLTSGLVQQIFEQGTAHEVINLYGPSEDTTYSTVARLARGSTAEPSIGRPIANTQAYLLDSFLQPVPVGIPGELYLGGAGLARGYLNRSSLTAEKFIPDPFSKEGGARLYKTGDLARYQSDGNIQFLGRLDHQVKLRGYRIELGEIESALRTHPAVRDTVVIVKDSAQDNKSLIAYVVAEAKTGAKTQAKSGVVDQSQLISELKAFLKQKLPDYMVPLFFVFLEKIPLTPNGKIDRQALPAPERGQPQMGESRVLPLDELEIQLVRIWQHVLELEAVGIDDNFFDLGGHSLLAVRLMAEIERVFGKKIPLISLFQGATISSLANVLRQDLDKYSWPTLVEIQRGSTKPPLFCVSTPNVNALGYLSLARHLGSEQPVYGLQTQYAEDLDGEHSQAAVEELAAEYLESLRKAQPHGPYQLIGMCRGAHIAYEMARRLEQEKATVALVGILDTWVMENTYNRLLYVEYYVRRLKSLLRLNPREAFTEISRRIEDLFQGTTTRSSKVYPATEVASKNPLHVYFPGSDFAPTTYGGRVSVFRSKKQPLNRIREKELGWARLAAGGVDLHYVSGNHGNVLREPYVKELARKLKQCLLGPASAIEGEHDGRRSKNSQAA